MVEETLQGGAAASPPWIDLLLQAGPVAKIVLAILALFSILSWAIILQKVVQFRRLRRQDERFQRLAGEAATLEETYRHAGAFRASPKASLFQAGFLDLRRRRDESTRLDAEGRARLQQTLALAAVEEVTALEAWMVFLATAASACPFIGLFGTVWGIMRSFTNITQAQSASIAVVAPGIAEALINTAAGLFAAIPAVIAYNVFVNRTRLLGRDLTSYARSLELLFESRLRDGKSSP